MTRRPTPACRAYLERVSRFVDGELSSQARQGTIVHLKHCPCCQDLVASLQRTLALCHAEGRRRLPPAVRARAQGRIARLLAGPATVSRRKC